MSLSVCEATSGSACVFILLNSHCVSSPISEKHTQLLWWFLSVAFLPEHLVLMQILWLWDGTTLVIFVFRE